MLCISFRLAAVCILSASNALIRLPSSLADSLGLCNSPITRLGIRWMCCTWDHTRPSQHTACTRRAGMSSSCFHLISCRSTASTAPWLCNVHHPIRVIRSPGRFNRTMCQAGHLQCFGGDGWGASLSLEQARKHQDCRIACGISCALRNLQHAHCTALKQFLCMSIDRYAVPKNNWQCKGCVLIQSSCALLHGCFREYKLISAGHRIHLQQKSPHHQHLSISCA